MQYLYCNVLIPIFFVLISVLILSGNIFFVCNQIRRASFDSDSKFSDADQGLAGSEVQDQSKPTQTKFPEAPFLPGVWF